MSDTDIPTKETYTEGELLDAMEAQGVPWMHQAVRCPSCDQVQSRADFDVIGASKSMFGTACIGRFATTGPACTATAFTVDRACVVSVSWNGGILYFPPATAEAAQAHMSTYRADPWRRQ